MAGEQSSPAICYTISMIKKLIIIFALLAVAPFLWWTISPLFIDIEVHDELPAVTVEKIPVSDSSEFQAETEEIEQTSETKEVTATQTVFPIVDTPTHRATGNIRIVETPEEKIVRFEDYEGTNGPDLKIYLAKDLEAKEFIDLGPSRANKGNINYSVPMNIDISEYKYVMTWCKAFGVLFDYAQIN